MTETYTPLRSLIADEFSLDAPLSISERAQLLSHAIELIADLNAVRAELEESLAADMEEDTFTVMGVGTLVRTKGGKRTAWDGESVVRHLVKRFGPGVDPETGEKLDPETLAARVAEDLAESGGLLRPSHGWRAGELKKRQVPVNDLCTYVEGKARVSFA